MSLNLLIDSANPIAWKKYSDLGILNGITTNPTLLKEARQPCKIENLIKLVNEAETLGFKEIHIQAWGNSRDELISCGKAIKNISRKNIKIFIKIPLTKTGCQAAHVLIQQNSLVTLTACYEAKQALLASSLGAKYIAPYLGRITDKGIDGLKEILNMHQSLNSLGNESQLLIASIRNTNQMLTLSKAGINTYTINEYIIDQLFEVESSIEATRKFQEDANFLRD